MNARREFTVPTASAMHALGAELGRVCEGGDMIILSGELGAGKTTFAQGIGSGLGIADPVTSPTFVISRVHQNIAGRPDLIHVDAYRLGSTTEVDDLDLDADLDTSVLVVEWGDGIVDALSDSRVVVRISRSEVDGDEARTVQITSESDRWLAVLPDLKVAS